MPKNLTLWSKYTPLKYYYLVQKGPNQPGRGRPPLPPNGQCPFKKRFSLWMPSHSSPLCLLVKNWNHTAKRYDWEKYSWTMSVKCDVCGKEVKPQVARQVVEEKGGEGASKQRLYKETWCKNIDKKGCPTSPTPYIQSLGIWDAHTKAIFLPHIVWKPGCIQISLLFRILLKMWYSQQKVYIYNLDIRWRHLLCHITLDCGIGIISKYLVGIFICQSYIS